MASTSTSTTGKLLKPTHFTPKRPLSSLSSRIGSDASRSSTPVNSLSSAKKFKALLSSEARTRSTVKTKPPALDSVPGTPTKKTGLDAARPKTPNTPKRGESPFADDRSERDVSRVDPEENLVDFQNVEAGDVSGDVDEAMLRATDPGTQDKVLVSIRIRPSEAPPAWDTANTLNKTIKLLPQHHRNSGTSPPEFHFDEILTGSENKPVYNAVARSHVCAAMDGFNAVIFAYGQTASGKTFTLSGDDEQPGIIPRAMKDVFAYIRRTPTREYLLRCSYLEIYNETIHDLLAPPSSTAAQPVQLQGTGANVFLSPLREEVVTSLKGVHEVLARGWGNRRTASTDWNERSSRSHSVFRVVIESRERGEGGGSGRQTPGLGVRPPTPGGPRLQALGGRSVQTSVLSLIDLAGSEKATSDKVRTREGKYINTSLLTLGTVIATLAENASKNKSDHVPYRNSKLTRMLQPSLSGDARISVIATINPDLSAVAESTSTLLFAQRIKKVQLSAKKKEVVDTDALLERYRQEIEELKKRLAEKEADAPVKGRRLSARESKAMKDLNSRIRQLTNLILTSQTVGGDESRPSSPAKIDFDMSPYQLQQELLSARRELDTQATQILSLEATLLARPSLPPDAPESDKDRLVAEQARTIRELEIVVRGYEENLGAPLRAVREDVEREWSEKVEKEVRRREEGEAWAAELVRELEKEKKARTRLEEERQALAAFVSRFDSLTAILPAPSARILHPTPGGAAAAFAGRQRQRAPPATTLAVVEEKETDSPMRLDIGKVKTEPSLLEEMWDGLDAEDSFEVIEMLKTGTSGLGKGGVKRGESPVREVLGGKENLPV
ncbi:kinesin-domain-containing protein [Auriscalpium vulgare]|uniref:Kinesin-domain-containing protein n=1 Tax=Auriscalpium vulgare TaxID=40419 RepID=A0ACB8R5Y2_9AGAM|nr:kinesin-domain-containing protein [Auriscalpium vulgare]